MVTKQMISSRKLLLGIFALFLILGVGVHNNAFAQTEGEEGWRDFVNLSRSGSTFAPVMVVDNEGTVRVVWKDAFDGEMFSERIEGEWSTPQPVVVPWAVPDGVNAQQTTNQYIPSMIVDDTNRIHAFWIGEENDLLYSNTPSARFGEKGWTSKQLLAENVVGFDAYLDPQGGLHISYVRNVDEEKNPAGVYYRNKKPKSTIWREAALLYESRYFREIESGNVALGTLVLEETVDESVVQTVFVSWDFRPRRELYLIRSGDGGITWDLPAPVSAPENNTDTVTPNYVGMVNNENKVLLIWKEMEMEIPSNCTQYFQIFSLGGEPDGAPSAMLREIPGCPLEKQTLIQKNGVILLQSTIFNETYLLAWNGERWSLPQSQPELSRVIDPGTFQTVQLRCMQLVYNGTDELFFIGCDTGTGGDIWFSSREQENVANWFAREPAWSAPFTIIASSGEITNVSLEADSNNLLHAVWAQSTVVKGSKNIYYARWNGKEWTHILPVIEPNLGQINQLATTIDANGRLFVVWSGGEGGEIYFTWANATLAGSSSEWTEPIVLPMPRLIGSSPDIVVADNGELYVTYAVPLNEQRGIYITRSSDGGRTWSDPIRVVDGAALNWEIVEKPSLGIGSDGSLHIQYLRYPAPYGAPINYLYYSYSKDGGDTWSDPEEIIQADVIWSSTGKQKESTTYRLWQENSRGGVATLIQTSSDNGVSWTPVINFAAFESRHAISDLAIDAAGNIHLVQISERATEALALQETLALQEWIWDGRNWSQGERNRISEGNLTDYNFITANITADGYLGVLFTKLKSDDISEGMELVFMDRKLEVTAPVLETPVPTETETPEPEIEETAVPTSTPTPSPTPLASVTRTPTERVTSTSSSDSIVFGVIAGFLSAGIIVLGTFFIFSRFTKRN